MYILHFYLIHYMYFPFCFIKCSYTIFSKPIDLTNFDVLLRVHNDKFPTQPLLCTCMFPIGMHKCFTGSKNVDSFSASKRAPIEPYYKYRLVCMTQMSTNFNFSKNNLICLGWLCLKRAFACVYLPFRCTYLSKHHHGNIKCSLRKLVF